MDSKHVTANTFSQDRLLYRRILGYVQPYKWALIGCMVTMALGGAVDGAFAWFLNHMLKTLFTDGNSGNAALAAVGIVVIFFVSGLANFVSGYGMQWVGNRVILDFRNQMFHRLIRLPAHYFDQSTIGTLMSKVTNDVISLQDASTTALNALVRGGTTMIVLLVTMFWMSWKLTLITFVTIPILGLIIGAFGKRLRLISRESQAAHAGITDALEESIRGQKVIKIFGGEAYEAKRFDHAANRVRRLSMKHSAAAAAATPFTQIIVATAIAVIVYLAASKTFSTAMSSADFVTFIVATAGLLPQIKGLASISERLQKGLASAESVFALIDAKPEEDHGTIAIKRAEGRIRFEHVSLQYADQAKPALDDVSFSIRAGETVALVGPSGGGKTSFVNLLPRFFAPTAGSIYVDDHALDSIRLADLRRQIALVSQDVILFNDTVAANIAYGRGYGSEASATLAEITEAARAANCLDFINALAQGFDTQIGENGSRLSGGQRQRLAIARALLKNAPILLLDEATSALDSESERAVQMALDTLMKGRTTIVVAHRLSTIENADRIVVMAHGKIVETGSHRELITQGGLYASLHRLQFANSY